MTNKETNKELNEILRYKCALTGKINHNTSEVNRLSILAASGKHPEYKDHLAREIRKGEAVISAQVTERTKLSTTKIAKMLGVQYHIVKWQEHVIKGPKL